MVKADKGDSFSVEELPNFCPQTTELLSPNYRTFVPKLPNFCPGMNPQTLVNSGLQRFQKCVSLISIYKAYNNAAALLDAGRPLFYYRHGNREIFSLPADLQQSAGIRRQNGEGLKNLKGTDRKHTPPPAVFSPPEQSSIFIDGQGEAYLLYRQEANH